MGLFCVYKHTAPNGKVYIGITSRKPEHRWNRGKGYLANKHFSNAISLYGWENFTHEIICKGLSKEDACKKEQELISEYKSNHKEYGYNLSSGGEASAKGAKFSEETKLKMSLARRGKKHREGTGRAISNAKKGRPNGLNGRKGKANAKAGQVFQIDESTNEIIAVFYGFNEMNRKTGFAMTPVKETVAGIRKRAYGYKWEYEKRGKKHVTF